MTEQKQMTDEDMKVLEEWQRTLPEFGIISLESGSENQVILLAELIAQCGLGWGLSMLVEKDNPKQAHAIMFGGAEKSAYALNVAAYLNGMRTFVAQAAEVKALRERVVQLEAETAFTKSALEAITNEASRFWLLENGMEGDGEVGMVPSFWSQKEAIFAHRVAMRAHCGIPAYFREQTQGGEGK